MCAADDRSVLIAVTSSPHHHSHEHTAESKVDKEKPVSADQIALAQLDRLIAFLDAHFGSIELLAPTEALAAQLFAGKEEEKPGAEAKEEGEFDAPIKEEEQDNDVAMRDGADEEDTKNESGSHVAPVSSSPILKLCIDAQDVYIPVDSMVRFSVALVRDNVVSSLTFSCATRRRLYAKRTNSGNGWSRLLS